jgi:AAA family ATP:ADP antiporter
MNALKQLWRSFFDIREGERLRVLFMFLYLLFVLFAYYILKPLSRALFINKFDIDKLPWLYVLIAAVGGILAYVYTKIAVRASLDRAVLGATVFSVVCLMALWILLQNPKDWFYYVFNIWVSLFSIMLVSQGWLIAANVFNSREAKRVYGVLGVGAVIGAAFGGSFTTFALKLLGLNNLVLASAVMVIFAYLSYLAVSRQPGVELSGAKAAEDEEADFHFGDIVHAIQGYRHLQVIIGIITLTYIVDVLVEYQFSAMAKEAYTTKEELTAFFGSFYGVYLNLVTFFLQFFFTAAVVSYFGVGGTLQIMPVTIGAISIATFLYPTVLSTAVARLSEAATRYSFNRTGMELLYLPLPADLKNRTKAFVDIFVDRFARGLGGMLLVVVSAWLSIETQHVSILVMVFCVTWIVLSMRARREYVSTVRKRLQARRLDLESVRISVNDPETIRLLEETSRSTIPRQASYALTLLEAAQSYPLGPLLQELIESAAPMVRGKVLELARKTGYGPLTPQALREIRSYRACEWSEAIHPAVAYALTFSEDGWASLAGRLREHPNEQVRESTILCLAENQAAARELITDEWLTSASADPDEHTRRLAALAIRACPNGHASRLTKLIRDPRPGVAKAAFQTAGILQDRAFVIPMAERLSDPRLRGAIVEALTSYGDRIAGTLGDLLTDSKTPLAVRRHAARVLQHIPHQRSADALLSAMEDNDLALRATIFRALHRLREAAPDLQYGSESVSRQIWNEARTYYELSAALAPFRGKTDKTTACGLLSNTLDARLRATIQRLFYLLGLKYPPREIYAAYLAVDRGKTEEISTAIEFLDNVLDRELKRVLLPLFDAPNHLAERGREVFGLDLLTPETALRKLLESGDEWLVACAIGAASEMGIRALLPRITELEKNAGAEVERVARDAVAALAG